jgi:hypothetical protein
MFLNILKWVAVIVGLFGVAIIVLNKVQPTNPLPAKLLGAVGIKLG